MKVAIVCDWIKDFGWAEIVLSDLLEMFPKADIYTSVFFQANNPIFKWRIITTSFIQKIPFLNKSHKLALTLRPLAFESFDFRDYDLVISSSSAESKWVITKPETLHICYCHTPTRYFWSHYHEYINMMEFGILNPIWKWLMPKIVHKLRQWDFVASKRPDYFIANSENTAKRIKKYYNRESKVIYPWIDLKSFKLNKKEDEYYLYVWRCIPYKKFDLIVDTFNENGKPLVLVTNTSNKLYKTLKAKSNSNIKWFINVPRQNIINLYSNAKAFLFPPEEDFGIVPIEAQASWLPVIAYKKWGALESIIEWVTWIFFEEQTVESLNKAIAKFEEMEFDYKEIRKHSEKFSKEIFKEELMKFIEEKNKKAFTLVELIVGITISMLLMLSVSIFVTDGIKNITNQKVSLESDLEIKEFTKDIYENLDGLDKNYAVTNTTSGVLFKVNKNYDKWWFSYIWELSLDKYYCASWSENEKTNHIITKTFIPFEWEWWDIFAWKSFSGWWIETNMFSWTINNSWILFWPTDVAFSWTIWYVSDTLWHSIYRFNTATFWSFVKIAWKEVFWDEFIDRSYWTGIYLNNPTWLEYATIWWTWYLFISDTLNDRILYLNLSNNKISKLLWREEWLKEPTWIYYDNTEKTLFIANSWKREILSYSSSWSFVDNINLSFTPKNNISPVNKLEFSFLFSSGSNNPILTSPSGTWSFIFTNLAVEEDLYETWSSYTGTYHFVKYLAPETSQIWCSNWIYKIISWSPVKCTNTWTWILWTYVDKTFTWWTNYNISINTLSWSNFSNPWAYYTKLDFLSWSTVSETYYFPYFVKWDNNLFTKSDNILKTVTWSLWYPTWIYANWSNLVYNDFTKRELVNITKTWSFVSSWNLTPLDFSKLALNSYTDTILYPPIKNYDIKYDSVSKLINIYFEYYKNFSCYSDENKSNVKEFILKKNLK